jgi:hypothetical protein
MTGAARLDRMRSRIPALVLIAALPFACAGPPAPSGARSIAPSAASTGSPPPAGTDAPTLTPVPDPTFRWRAIGEPVVFRDAHVNAIAPIDAGFVAVGCTLGVDTCRAPVVWFSADGVDWSPPTELPLQPGETPRAATAAVATDDGLVVAGEVGRGDRIHAALWVASDGEPFGRIPDDPSFADASIGHLLLVNGSLLAVGSGAYTHYSGFRAWRSEDGIAWIATARGLNDESWPHGAVGIDGGVVAWGDTCSVCVPDTAFWRSADGLTWTEARRELDGASAHATTIGITHDGLVAFGTVGVDPAIPAAWSLANGSAAWQADEPPPQPAGATISTHVVVGHGTLLAGTSYAADSPTGLVWLRGPGDAAWRPPLRAPGVWVRTVLQDPDRPAEPILVGEVSRDGRQAISLWSGSVDWAP